MMMRRQIAVALTGIIAGNTVLFAHAAATTETQSERTADRYMIIDLAGIPFTWTDESLTETQVSEAVSTEFEDFSESSLEAEEPPYYMSLTSLDNEYIAHLDQFDSLKNSTNPIDMYTSSQMAYAVSDIRTDESIISYLLDQYAGYDIYSAVEFCEAASLQQADESGMYRLLLQQEEGADVVHYSMSDGTLQKTAVDSFVNEYGDTAVSLDANTNHWLIVHLIPESTPDESSVDGENQEETDEAASQSLEGKVDEDTSETSSQNVAKADPTKPSATVAPTAATTATTTTSPAPTTTQTPTAAPTTTAHTHNWVAVTKTVHHDAVTSQVWKEDSAAWDETVVTKAAWDEQVLSQAAYDEPVLVSEAYDEPVYGWVGVCNACGHKFFDPNEDIDVHMHQGCWSSWHDEWLQIGTTHHDAVYSTVHHDAVYTTVHHDAETTVVHHDATGHYETVVTQAAWDETVTTGYKCSGCGATK